VERIFEELSGETTYFFGIPSGTDPRLYVLDGGIPTLCFGSRDVSIHGLDEYVVIDSLIEATKVFVLTILESKHINKDWKQNVPIGRKNNQNFVQSVGLHPERYSIVLNGSISRK